MRSWRTTTAAVVVAVAVLLAAAGCSRDSKADPIPPTSSAPSSTTPSPSPPKSTGGPPAGWEKRFSQRQLNTYNAALARYQRYTQRTDEIYRRGKDTPEARKVLQKYVLLWQRDIVTLAETFDKGGVRLEVPPKRLWTYARTVKPGDVILVQCIDYTHMRYTQNGKLLRNKPKHLVTPLIVEMTKPKNRDWMFVSGKLKDKTSCVA